jgi:hypothetical protein
VVTIRNGRRPARLRAMLIPADTRDPARLVEVEDTADSIAAAIGAYLIDDALTCRLPVGPDPHRCTLYRPCDGTSVLPLNRRAVELLGELGGGSEALRGDILVLGLSEGAERDLAVPDQVLDTAARIGLLH